MQPSMNKEIVNELRRIMMLRGEATKEQKAYSRVEEHAMMERYPIPKPSEEKRLSHLRTLDRYIGQSAAMRMIESRKFILSARPSLSLN